MSLQKLFARGLYASLAVLCLLNLSACRPDPENDDDDPSTYPKSEDISNGVTVRYSAMVFGTLSDGFAEAVDERFPNKADEAGSADIGIVDSKNLSVFTTDLLKIYQNRGMIVIVRPDPTTVNQWFQSLNLSKEMDSSWEDTDIFAFSANQQFLLDKHLDNWTISENMNQFTVWVNEVFTQGVQSLYPVIGSGETDLEKIIGGYKYNYAYNFSREDFLRELLWSNPDMVNGSGQLSCSYEVFPLFKYPDNYPANKVGSDFYIVKATFSVANAEMTIRPDDGKYQNFYKWKDGTRMYHNWVNLHGGSYVRICGYYMTHFEVEAYPVEQGDKYEFLPGYWVNRYSKINANFPAGADPSPKTTQHSTSYSVQTNFNFNGSLSFGAKWKPDSSGYHIKPSGIDASVTLSGGYSYSKQKSFEISDLNVLNMSQSPNAKFDFVVQGKPEFSSSKTRITNPPFVAVATTSYDGAWIWEVPGVEVGSDRKFGISTKLKAEYGCCHFLTSDADMREITVEEFAQHTVPVSPPNRTPTGLLQILNIDDGSSLSEIEIVDMKTHTTVLKSTAENGSLASGQTFSYYLPVGNYSISFKRGKKIADTKRYKLSGRNYVEINFAATTSLNTDFDFEEAN